MHSTLAPRWRVPRHLLHLQPRVQIHLFLQMQIYGLKVLWREGVPWVAIANQHSGLGALFERSHWAGKSGTSGVWAQAFRRLEGAERSKSAVRFGAYTARATLVPIATMLPEGGE